LLNKYVSYQYNNTYQEEARFQYQKLILAQVS
jgi:hypothetical protein